jgi:tetratricopeptide (TPR) repeat protein
LAYHKGLQVELAVLVASNPNICVTYTNIAEIHKQRAEFDQALSNYSKVLELQRKHDVNPLDIANTLCSIGYVRHQKGDFQGAMDVNQECLRIRREVKGDLDEDVAASLTHIALVLLKMDMHGMALQVLAEAYRIRTKLNKKGNRDIAFTLYNIALIYHHQGSHERALVLCGNGADRKARLGRSTSRFVDYLLQHWPDLLPKGRHGVGH